MKLVDKIHKEWMAKDFSVPKQEKSIWPILRWSPPLTPEQQEELDYIESHRGDEFRNLDNQLRI